MCVGRAGVVTLLEGDDSGVPTEASYETHVTMTSETSFVEEGEIAFHGGACGWALPAQELSSPPRRRAPCEAQ
jgi:hypothetical protein